MEAYVAGKRFSVYLVLICWGIAVSMMHPGFAMMVTGTILLFLLFVLRFLSHFEGQYMIKVAEARHGAGQGHGSVYRRLLLEIGVAFAIFVPLAILLVTVARHIPLVWMPSSS